MTHTGAYGPGDYDAMFADGVRRQAYLDAISKTVIPGDVVVEIGTGLGYFAIAAARAGARHVFAIERELSVHLAEEIIRENGLSDRITCIPGDAASVILPERGTVLLSDLRGTLPLYGSAIPTIASARDRLLVPGARMIPVRDTVYCAPSAAPAKWQAVEATLSSDLIGVRRTAATRIARCTPQRAKLGAGDLFAEPAEVAVIDYARSPAADVDVTMRWTIDRDAQVDGLALWFDAELCDGITFTCRPGAAETVYGQLFLPFSESVAVRRGGWIESELRARLVGGEYVFAWRTTCAGEGGASRVTFNQSSLGALVASPGDLAHRSGGHVPSGECRAHLSVLAGLVDGRRSQSELAAEMLRAAPERFADDAAALDWVVGVLRAIDRY